MELHRLFRSDHFNIISKKRHVKKGTSNLGQCHENVLLGDITTKERKLFVKSPAVLEVSIGSNHSHELLQLGIVPVRSRDMGLLSLQDAYNLTEEYLEGNEISVGILGHSRDCYEPLLQPKEKLIGPVKRYTISSGLPGIFPGRLIQSETASLAEESVSQANTSKITTEKVAEEEEEESIQIVLRSEEYYKELHKRRNKAARKMWLQNRSILGTQQLAGLSNMRKYSTGLLNI